jgi:hypothetical protein
MRGVAHMGVSRFAPNASAWTPPQTCHIVPLIYSTNKYGGTRGDRDCDRAERDNGLRSTQRRDRRHEELKELSELKELM